MRSTSAPTENPIPNAAGTATAEPNSAKANTPTADLVTLLGFIIGLTIIGIGLTKAFGLAQEDNTAIEMEVVVRNINLGFLLKASLFPLVAGEVNAVADMVLLSLLLYGSWQLVMGVVFIVWRRSG
jgi:BASS family bile acid:Na+ symporter